MQNKNSFCKLLTDKLFNNNGNGYLEPFQSSFPIRKTVMGKVNNLLLYVNICFIDSGYRAQMLNFVSQISKIHNTIGDNCS